MFRTLLPTLAILGLGLSAGCSDDPAPPADPTPVWREAFDTSATGSLSGVWGSGPSDVFVVGGDEESGQIYHFDGIAWAPMELPPDVPLLVWVYGFGPNDVYAVGVSGAALHYDGARWTALETGVSDDLWGVFGLAPDDVWIVGGDARGVDVPPVLLHYDGDTFEPHTIDAAQNPRNASALFKVWGFGDRLIAVGQRGWIVERVGDDWVQRPAGAQANQDFVSLWGTSSEDIVVVGGRSNARVAEWDGQAFSTVAPQGLGGLNAVFVDGDGTVLIGGVFGFVGTYDTDTNEVTSEHSPGGSDAVHAIWSDGAGRAYAVGGSFLVPHRGLAWVRTVE